MEPRYRCVPREILVILAVTLTGSVLLPTRAVGQNTTATVTIDPTADTTVEGNETAILTVTTGAGYNVASPSQATGTITNDDTDVTLAVSPALVSEDGATNLVYTFTRNGVTSVVGSPTDWATMTMSRCFL